MDTTTFGFDSTDIAFWQLFATIVGGGFAIYLFIKSNKDKRRAFILSIYEKLYSDNEIKTIIYATDKDRGLEQLKLKIETGNTDEVELEREADKTLHFLDFVGALIKEGHLNLRDLKPFKYEIDKIFNDSTIDLYISYQKSIGVNFENLDWLRKRLH